ncbi:MAG TPA: OmpH family outer membrane protein [Pirellulales bacterium]|nr:OmpH family outer membrane protein [Pirellulales bacterium]
MKTTFSYIAFAAALAILAGNTSSSLAQAPQYGAPAPGMTSGVGQTQPMAPPMQGAPVANAGLGVNGIAVVDVAYIFKKHARFLQEMDMMKQKVEAAEQGLKKDQDDLKRMSDQLKTFAPGSPDYKKMEADMLKKQGDINLNVSLQKKDFMDQEGRIYFNVSREIDDAVKQIATKNNIVLVLRFNGDPVDPADRNDILRGINKPIVYYDQRMDITPYVLQDLNRSAAPGTGNIGVRPQPTGTQPLR